MTVHPFKFIPAPLNKWQRAFLPPLATYPTVETSPGRFTSVPFLPGQWSPLVAKLRTLSLSLLPASARSHRRSELSPQADCFPLFRYQDAGVFLVEAWDHHPGRLKSRNPAILPPVFPGETARCWKLPPCSFSCYLPHGGVLRSSFHSLAFPAEGALRPPGDPLFRIVSGPDRTGGRRSGPPFFSLFLVSFNLLP